MSALESDDVAGRVRLSPADRERPVLSRLLAHGGVRRLAIVLVIALIWQAYAVILDKPLVFPTLTATLRALIDGLLHGELMSRIGTSLRVLCLAYAIGVGISLVLTILASTTRIGADVLNTLSSMLNPLPAIALLPVALLWFGLGLPSMIFVLVHAILWPMALNATNGLSAVSPTLRMVGQNLGLSNTGLIVRILLPAAMPSLLTGLRLGWAFGWRTLIAAELVFGVSSSSGGLGWFIYENKMQMETPSVFAGLVCITLIGLLVERLIFVALENATVVRWGLLHRST